MEDAQKQLQENPVESEQPEKLLYHYTTQAGLLGILEKKQIWATHYRYLNDISEGKIISDALWGEFISRLHASDSFWRELGIPRVSGTSSLKIAEDDMDIYDSGLSFLSQISQQDTFVTSFSAEGDLLSQWRGYTDSLEGYSIGFSKDHLEKVAKSFSGHLSGDFACKTDSLVKCIYSNFDEKEKIGADCEAAVSAYIQNAKEIKLSYGGFGSLPGQLHQAARNHFYPFLLRTIATKDGSFHEEAEWRFIFNSSSPDFEELADIQFRTGRSMITPYLQVPLGTELYPFAIKKIIVGPCPHPEEAIKAIKMYLKKSGMDTNVVEKSKIPYRNW